MTVSAAGKYRVANVLSPKFMDVSVGYEYAIVFANQTAGDLAGVFTFETADALPNDPCAPDTWRPLQVRPECDDNPAVVTGPGSIDFTNNPVKAGTECQVAINCPGQFVRVAGAATTLDVLGVVGRLRRTI